MSSATPFPSDASASSRYLDQSIAQLMLRVFQGAPEPCPQILRVGELRAPQLSLRAHVVGSSHWLEFQAEGHSPVSELLACGAVDPRGDVSLFLTEVSAPVELEIDGLGYRFECDLCPAPAGAVRLQRLTERIENAERFSDQLGLEYTFPQRVAHAAPKTLLWAARSGRQELEIETAHCYPNEGRIAFSRSVVRCLQEES